MDEFFQILAHAVKNGKLKISFPNTRLTPEEIVEMKCYAALCQIRRIIADASMDDSECFYKIEQIISTLETAGLDAGGRHDFG